jgi:serine/threonine protein kinase
MSFVSSDISSDYICINKYKVFLSKKIGDGLTSSVYEGINLNTNEKVAIKVIDKNRNIKNFKNSINFVVNEINMLNLVKNKNNFIQLIDNFEDSMKYYLIFEYAVNTLNSIIHNIPKEHIFHYLKQLLNALIDMYNLNLIHNDIKPNNILLFYDISSQNLFNLKIADFGMSELYEGKINNVCGSPMYMNLNKFLGIHDYSSDFWSVKLIYYQLVYGKHPFRHAKTHDDIKNLLRDILDNKPNSICYPYEYNPHTMLLKKLFSNIITKPQDILNEIDKIEKINIEDNNIKNIKSIDIINRNKSNISSVNNSINNFININNTTMINMADYNYSTYSDISEKDLSQNDLDDLDILDDFNNFILLD